MEQWLGRRGSANQLQGMNCMTRPLKRKHATKSQCRSVGFDFVRVTVFGWGGMMPQRWLLHVKMGLPVSFPAVVLAKSAADIRPEIEPRPIQM